MKEILKKLSCVILTAVMICIMAPLAVNAGSVISYDKNRTLYNYGKDNLIPSETIIITGIPSNQQISKASVKVISGKNVISLVEFSKHIGNYSTEYFKKGSKTSTKKEHYYSISVRPKRTGTGKISFKVGKKTYTTTIKILPYENPLSSLTVTGIKNGSNGNLAGKFKTNHFVMERTRINKTQKNAVITCKAAEGWKITSLGFTNNKTNVTRMIDNEKGVSSVKLRIGDLVVKQTGYISISLINTKTGGTQDCTLDWSE